jgi:hypothetical protein
VEIDMKRAKRWVNIVAARGDERDCWDVSGEQSPVWAMRCCLIYS